VSFPLPVQVKLAVPLPESLLLLKVSVANVPLPLFDSYEAEKNPWSSSFPLEGAEEKSLKNPPFDTDLTVKSAEGNVTTASAPKADWDSTSIWIFI